MALLTPIKILAAFVYGIAVRVRNKLYDWKIFHSTEFQIPVVVLGNITVGGTGKTPHTEMLVRLLRQHFNLAILSRGYKRKTKGFSYVEVSSKAYEVGDEPLQMKLKYPEITVAVDADRVEGISKLKQDTAMDVVLLDDAFQHRRLKPSLSIVLVDYNRPIKGDKMIPWGNLRDTPSQLKRADIVIITKAPSNLNPLDLRLLEKDMSLYPYQQLYITTLAYGKPVAVFKNHVARMETNSSSALLVTGIANPKPLYEYISARVEQLGCIEFPDHHTFSKKDIQRIVREADGYSTVYTTEKDAVRLREADGLTDEVKAKLYYIPIEVEFICGKEKFTKYMIDYVRKNKRNNILYTR